MNIKLLPIVALVSVMGLAACQEEESEVIENEDSEEVETEETPIVE